MKIFFIFSPLPTERGGKWKHEILMSDDRKLQPLKTGMFFARITSTKQVDKWLYFAVSRISSTCFLFSPRYDVMNPNNLYSLLVEKLLSQVPSNYLIAQQKTKVALGGLPQFST
jgi:hypothetical protein